MTKRSAQMTLDAWLALARSSVVRSRIANEEGLDDFQSIVRVVARFDAPVWDEAVAMLHMVYGWMPTMLRPIAEHTESDRKRLLAVLAAVKRGDVLDSSRLALVQKFANRSVVGASKLLHVLNPENYALWDSRVAEVFLWHGATQATYSTLDRYVEYLGIIRVWVKKAEVIRLCAEIRKLNKALVESAVSSNRIEGVEVDRSRIGTLMFGTSRFRNRDEEELRGYRDALNLIHERRATLSISEETIKRLHRLCRGDIWDAGAYKEKDVDIIQTYPDGGSRVRFRSTPAAQTPQAMAELVSLWERGLRERWVHPLILAAALNLDFLCIHPFRDGNGRVSRLLLLLACYHCGMEAGRYISMERGIEQNKERYYEVLEQSSQGWHEGKHDPWPTINFLLYILLQTSREFENRLGQLKSPRGEKTAAVVAAVERLATVFRMADVQAGCPGVGIDLIRRVLADLQKENRIRSLGTGRGAQWEKLN